MGIGLPLPWASGAATESKQNTQIAAEQAILAKIIATPATEAKQDTGNTSLASIAAQTPTLVSGNVPMHLGEVLSYLLDSIDVAKMSKGAVTTAHSAIAATATSAEIDCRGFNSLLVAWSSDATDKTWTIGLIGSMTSGGTFVAHLDAAGAAIVYTTDISGWYTVTGIPDYVKIVATEVDNGATVSCSVQPFNV